MVISIYGGSGSGKTTLATALQQYFLMTAGAVTCSRAMIIHTGSQNATMKNSCVCIKKPGKTDCVDISEQRKRLISPGSMKCLRHFMREKIRSRCGIWNGKMARFHQKKPIFLEHLYCFWSGRTEAVTIYMVWIYPSFWKVPGGDKGAAHPQKPRRECRKPVYLPCGGTGTGKTRSAAQKCRIDRGKGRKCL